MELFNQIEILFTTDKFGKHKLTEEAKAYINSLSMYIENNLIRIEKYRLHIFYRCLNYKNLNEYIKEIFYDFFKLKLHNLKDNCQSLSIVKRYNRMNNAFFITPLMYIKKLYIEINIDILDLTTVMIMNYGKEVLKLNNYEYKKIIEIQLNNIAYQNFRYRYRNPKLKNYLKNELKFVNKEIEESINIKQQFKFLLSNNELMSLSIQLQQLGFINDAISFSQLFKVKNEINELPSHKIVWNGSLLELAYFFKILIYSKIIHYSNIKLLYKNISDVFMDKSNNIIKNKSISSKASRTLKINPNLFNDTAPQKPKNLILLYELVKSFSSEWDIVNTIK